jgi:hypothetical protein
MHVHAALLPPGDHVHSFQELSTLDEIKALNTFHHPNIIPLLDHVLHMHAEHLRSLAHYTCVFRQLFGKIAS